MNPEIERKIDELLSQMTVAEKVGQLQQWGCDESIVDEVRARLAKGQLGGFLFPRCAWSEDGEEMKKSRDYLNALQKVAVEESRLGIPAIFGRDVIHGHHTAFPVGTALAASFNPDMVEESYAAIGREAANCGLKWCFAPMIDLSHDPRWGRTVEGIGEDPYLGEQMAAAMVRGYQGREAEDLKKPGKVAACAKHYIAYGAAEGGRDYHKAEVTDYSLRNYYLPPYRGAVNAGVRTIMSSFNEVGGQPVTSSRYLLTDLLRDELGFDGFVVSDDHAIIQLKRQGVAANDGDCARLAVNAGLDMDMNDMIYHNNLEEQVNSGLVPMENLDACVRNVLRVKFELGLFDDPYAHEVEVDYAYHSRLAKDMASECIVLLKNNDNLLPLSKDTKKVVGIGNFWVKNTSVEGCWSCDPVHAWVKGLDESIREAAPNTAVCGYSSGYGLVDAWGLKQHMDSDAVIVAIGGSTLFEGEAGSLADLELPADQKYMIENARRLGKKVIGVLFYGRPMALESVEHYFDAIVWAWHSGTNTCPAVADILFGNTNPSGKLSMTLPRVTGQIPIYYNLPKGCREIDGYYGRVNALENYRDCIGSPLYPFGYGLSYTTFEYSPAAVKKAKISLDDLKAGEVFEVSVTVKNTGSMAGKEVVQCYTRDDIASMTRPVKELKGFVKPMIEAGEEITITFRLGWDELGFYHADKTFAPEKGTFKVYVGTDCYVSDFIEIEII